jgi:serine/threonine protein kinase
MDNACIEKLERCEKIQKLRAGDVTLDHFTTEKHPNGNTIIHGGGMSGFLIAGKYMPINGCQKIPRGQWLALRVSFAYDEGLNPKTNELVNTLTQELSMVPLLPDHPSIVKPLCWFKTPQDLTHIGMYYGYHSGDKSFTPHPVERDLFQKHTIVVVSPLWEYVLCDKLNKARSFLHSVLDLLSPPDAGELLDDFEVQLRDAIDALKQCFISHNDIKSDNVVVRRDVTAKFGWRVALIDFGEMRQFATADMVLGPEQGTPAGAPQHKPPNIAQTRCYKDADCYACECTLSDLRKELEEWKASPKPAQPKISATSSASLKLVVSRKTEKALVMLSSSSSDRRRSVKLNDAVQAIAYIGNSVDLFFVAYANRLAAYYSDFTSKCWQKNPEDRGVAAALQIGGTNRLLWIFRCRPLAVEQAVFVTDGTTRCVSCKTKKVDLEGFPDTFAASTAALCSETRHTLVVGGVDGESGLLLVFTLLERDEQLGGNCIARINTGSSPRGLAHVGHTAIFAVLLDSSVFAFAAPEGSHHGDDDDDDDVCEVYSLASEDTAEALTIPPGCLPACRVGELDAVLAVCQTPERQLCLLERQSNNALPLLVKTFTVSAKRDRVQAVSCTNLLASCDQYQDVNLIFAFCSS